MYTALGGGGGVFQKFEWTPDEFQLRKYYDQLQNVDDSGGTSKTVVRGEKGKASCIAQARIQPCLNQTYCKIRISLLGQG